MSPPGSSSGRAAPHAKILSRASSHGGGRLAAGPARAPRRAHLLSTVMSMSTRRDPRVERPRTPHAVPNTGAVSYGCREALLGMSGYNGRHATSLGPRACGYPSPCRDACSIRTGRVPGHSTEGVAMGLGSSPGTPVAISRLPACCARSRPAALRLATSHHPEISTDGVMERGKAGTSTIANYTRPDVVPRPSRARLAPTRRISLEALDRGPGDLCCPEPPYA